jgi:hypothetical protein
MTRAGPGIISLEELAGMDVIHGPRRADPGTYDAWTRALQAVDPRFGFTDPPFRSSSTLRRACPPLLAGPGPHLVSRRLGQAAAPGPNPRLTAAARLDTWSRL